jgi:hypothetical protein
MGENLVQVEAMMPKVLDRAAGARVIVCEHLD